MRVCSAGDSGGAQRTSIHPHRSPAAANVVNEWARIGRQDLLDLLQCARENRTRILSRNIPAGENERADAGGVQSEAFELAVADALVAGEDNPTVPAGLGQPCFVGSALGKVIRQPLNYRPRITQRGDDSQAVKRLVNKKNGPFRQL